VREALGCGTPVVATNVGGIPSLISSDLYGIIVPVNDQAALQEALRQALQRQWDRSAICAWGQSRTWAQVAREVFEEMREVVAQEAERKVVCK